MTADIKKTRDHLTRIQTQVVELPCACAVWFTLQERFPVAMSHVAAAIRFTGNVLIRSVRRSPTLPACEQRSAPHGIHLLTTSQLDLGADAVVRTETTLWALKSGRLLVVATDDERTLDLLIDGVLVLVVSRM